MDIVQTLREDYRKFPKDQSYDLYAENVFFQDPMNRFRGVKRYQQMIGFIDTWFIDPKMDLHHIQRLEELIKMEWTLSWKTPLPWKPRIAIDGWSELQLNSEDLIVSHVDHWHCSRLDVLKQHLFLRKNR